MFDDDDEVPQHLIDMSIRNDKGYGNFVVSNEKIVND